MIKQEPKKRGRKAKKVEDEKKDLPKKRGRKPKVKEIIEEPKIHKKRGRRKKCYIDSISKISGFCASGDSIDTIDNNKLKFSNDFVDKDKIGKDGSEKISFGSFNIGVRPSEENNNIDLIKKYHQDTKKTKCIIDLPDYSDSDDEKKTTQTTVLQNFPTIKKTKTKKKNKGMIWKEKSYEKLHLVLEQYRGKENKKFEWPETTDICCWWCCHQFENSPVTLPYKYDEIRNRFKVMGMFCSWSCAKSYAMDDNSVQNRTYSVLNLSEFTRQIYGHTINIPCAPPRQILKMFGGNLSINEFRNINPNNYIRINNVDSVLDPNVYFSFSIE